MAEDVPRLVAGLGSSSGDCPFARHKLMLVESTALFGCFLDTESRRSLIVRAADCVSLLPL